MLCQTSLLYKLTTILTLCGILYSASADRYASFSVIPAHGVDDTTFPLRADLGADVQNPGEAARLEAQKSILNLFQAGSAVHRGGEGGGGGQGGLAFQKAEKAAKAVWDVADQLYEAASRENVRDANHRMARAVAGAQQNWDKLSGHEFGPRPGAISDVTFLSQRADVKNLLSSKASSSACRSGCSGHGSCNAGQCACAKSWVGELCDVQRCPADCSDRGMCISGKCICNPKHFGDSCQHARCPADCSGRGYCFNGRCQCTGGFGGEDCLLQVRSSNVVRFKLAKKRPLTEGIPQVPSSLRASAANSNPEASESLVNLKIARATDSDEQEEELECPGSCSSRGNCVKGRCLCYSGFQGGDCSMVGPCNAHGTPKVSVLAAGEEEDAQGAQTTCVCDQGWSGSECSVELVCPDQSCSGHGVCSYGRCNCGAGYSGDSCHIALAQIATGEKHTKSAVLLGMQKSHAGANSNAFLHKESMSTVKDQESSDTMFSPMTAAWLRPSTFVRPASNKVKLEASVLTSPGSAATSQTSAAVPSKDLSWHPATVPLATNTDSSAVSFLGTDAGRASLARGDAKDLASASGEATWTERPLQSTAQSHNTDKSEMIYPLHKKLTSLLALSPKAPSLLSNVDGLDGQPSDIDALLGADI